MGESLLQLNETGDLSLYPRRKACAQGSMSFADYGVQRPLTVEDVVKKLEQTNPALFTFDTYLEEEGYRQIEERGLEDMSDEAYEAWKTTLTDEDKRDLKYNHRNVWLPETRERWKRDTESLINVPSKTTFAKRIKLYEKSKKGYADQIKKMRKTLIELHKIELTP